MLPINPETLALGDLVHRLERAPAAEIKSPFSLSFAFSWCCRPAICQPDKNMHYRVTLQVLLLVAEIVGLCFVFSLFANAYPDKYRTALWQYGGTNGWNSDPSLRVYYYANYKEAPEIPLIWSQRYGSLSCEPFIFDFASGDKTPQQSHMYTNRDMLINSG